MGRYKEAMRLYAAVMKRFEADADVVARATGMYTTILLLMAADARLYVQE
jgi:hypothetical protein